MIIDICIIVSAAAFLIFVAFFIVCAIQIRKSLKETTRKLNKALKDFDELSEESIEMVQNVNDLAIDFKKKSEALNFVFKPLSELNQKHKKELILQEKKTYEDIADILECVTSGIILFNKIRGGLKKHAK